MIKKKQLKKLAQMAAADVKSINDNRRFECVFSSLDEKKWESLNALGAEGLLDAIVGALPNKD